MLYKFKSKNAADVIMLQANAQHVLQIIGKHKSADPSVKGILLPEQMAQALEALQSAIEQEETARQAALALALALAEHLPTPRFAEVSLRQRALPLMEMMRDCSKVSEPITWGV